jgi:hypothetical protein
LLNKLFETVITIFARLSNCGNFLRASTTSYIVVTHIIPLEKNHWHSKNVEDWMIRSEATYFVSTFQKGGAKLFIIFYILAPPF